MLFLVCVLALFCRVSGVQCNCSYLPYNQAGCIGEENRTIPIGTGQTGECKAISWEYPVLGKFTQYMINSCTSKQINFTVTNSTDCSDKKLTFVVQPVGICEAGKVSGASWKAYRWVCNDSAATAALPGLWGVTAAFGFLLLALQ